LTVNSNTSVGLNLTFPWAELGTRRIRVHTLDQAQAIPEVERLELILHLSWMVNVEVQREAARSQDCFCRQMLISGAFSARPPAPPAEPAPQSPQSFSSQLTPPIAYRLRGGGRQLRQTLYERGCGPSLSSPQISPPRFFSCEDYAAGGEVTTLVWYTCRPALDASISTSASG